MSSCWSAATLHVIPCKVVLLGWYERFRDASAALDTDDPDAQAARNQAKVIRTHGIGVIGSGEHLKGKPATARNADSTSCRKPAPTSFTGCIGSGSARGSGRWLWRPTPSCTPPITRIR